MMPIGPLMIEHRLIERMIKLVDREAGTMKGIGKVDIAFIDAAIEFIRTYADHCHHGKEEDILFADLSHRDISPEHHEMVKSLIGDHVWARQKVGQLVSAKERLANGQASALQDVISLLEALAGFYPEHIRKEDREFFLPVMNYYSKQEQDDMLQAFWEYDRKLIHEKYRALVETLEKA